MEVKLNVEFENISKIINRILSVSGYNILDENWRRGFKGKVMYLVPTITMIFVPFWSFYAVLYNLHDFEKLLYTSLSCGACFQLTFKLIAINSMYKDIQYLVNNCRNFRIQFAEDISDEKLSDRSITTSTKFVVKTFYFSCVVLDIIMALAPLFKSERSFNMAYYLPFADPFESPYYEIGSVLNTYEFFVYMHLAVGLDSFFIFLVSEMCLQYNIIKYVLSGLKGDADSERKLRKIHQMYRSASENVKMVNRIFYNICLTQFLSSFLMICSALFMAMHTSNYEFAINVVIFISQLGLYCVYGEFLKYKIENFIFALYDNEWYDMEQKEKKSLMIMMTYAQVDQTLKAGGIIELSLASYLQILKSAYTYCAVMGDIEI